MRLMPRYADWVGLPSALNCKSLNKPVKGNPMKEDLTYSPPPSQPVNMLVDLGQMILKELKNQARESD